MLRALAWDDQPDYLTEVAKKLQDFGIRLEIESDVHEFNVRVDSEDWDFLVTDLIDDAPFVAGEKLVGQRVCQLYADKFPIFLVTQEPSRLHDQSVNVPRSVTVKSKEIEPAWMAMEILNELKRQGLYVNTGRVFLIYGHDESSVKDVELHLAQDLGLKVEKITAANLSIALASGLVGRMNRCGCFVAVCTPDDELADGTFRARQNVILEMGIAMGLGRGVERLIVLQRWGDNSSTRAELPSDLSGVLTLRFKMEVKDSFTALRGRLKALRMDI